MKTMLLVLVFTQSLMAQADFIKVDISKYAISFKDNTNDGRLQAYIPGLKSDLFKELLLKDSRGPKWKEIAISSISGVTDFHERSSYFGESYNGECDAYFQNGSDGAYDTDEVFPSFKWKAVKKIKGTQKSIMYILEYYTKLIGNREVNGSRDCYIYEDEYVFENKLDAYKMPVYLGERVGSLPLGL